MVREPKSIGEHIDCLARLTGAPGSFVDQVRSLFTAKGISLDTSAEPFLDALDEAFRREERIRRHTVRVQQNLRSMQDNFRKVGQAYVDRIRENKGSGESRVEVRRRATKTAPRSTRITIKGDHRTFVTRMEREELPMVPGPSDPQ